MPKRTFTPEQVNQRRINQTAWREHNREKLRAGYKKFYDANKESRAETSKKCNLKHGEKRKAARKVFRAVHKERLNAVVREWRLHNREKMKTGQRDYVQRNKAKRSKQQSAYICARRKRDPQFRLLMNLRLRVWCALKGHWGVKSARTLQLVGCDIPFFKSFLECQFEPWMNWDNYGERWEIDHAIPLEHFDLRDPVQQRQAFNYSNCKPLCKIENASKRDTLPGPHQPLLM